MNDRRLAAAWALLLLLGLLAIAACGKNDAKGGVASAAPEPPKRASELNLLIFSDYIDDKIVADFEKKSGVRVRITTYESTEEMENKLSYAGADGQYDVVVVASQALPRLVRRGTLRELDHGKIPNLKNLDSKFAGANFDSGNEHGVPYQWGTVGLLYNKKKLPRLEPSWSVVLDPKKIAGTFVLLDEMRDMMGVALKYKGYSANTADPAQIRDGGGILEKVKVHPKCLGFKGGFGAVQDVVAGSADIAVAWNGDAIREVAKDGDRLAYVVPREGSIRWLDAMTITKRAPSQDLAHEFINFILDPEVGARLSTFNRYATPNAASKARLSREDIQDESLYPSDEMMSKLEHHRELGEAGKIYDEAWAALKAR